jgi:hypothetical protein
MRLHIDLMNFHQDPTRNSILYTNVTKLDNIFVTANKTLGSLYPNVNLARTMAEKHDAGLIWTNDVYSGKVPWSTLKPWVVVNRFPRNGCPEIKLCGHGMVGKPEYDGYHPRTYKNTTVDSGFMEDFALTACVSLLRMFADKIVKCKESGKVRVYQTIFRL